MVIGIVILVVVVALFALMRWADRRDRAKGHVNRPTRDLKTAIRAGKEHKLEIQLRDPRRPPGPKQQ